MSKVYKVAHQRIDGSIVDREKAFPDLTLEMHPLGTELPPEKQSRELHLRISASSTVLDKRGIEELKAFLEVIP